MNLGVQRQLPGNMLVEVTYTNNLSRKLPIGTMNINQIPHELMGPDANQTLRPYPQFNAVRVRSATLGSNNYHAGSIRVEKRLSHGLSFLSGYTWARSIGDASNTTSGELGDNQIWQDIYNRRLDRGPDALDIIHRFTFSATYDLPWGKGRRWLTDGVLSSIVGGWNIGSIVILQSGGPFTTTMQTNTTEAFSAGSLRANRIGEPNLPNSERTVQRWFNTDAFEAPQPFTFGNAGRGIIRADGLVSFDLSISKNFLFREGMYLQFRGDFFNAFNHPDFNRPNSTMGSASFGSISSATAGRTIQLGGRFNF